MQKRDSGSATLACSDGGKSSLTKSFTAPPTRLEDGINFLSEQRTWNSMVEENVPADFLIVDLGHDFIVSASYRGGRSLWAPQCSNLKGFAGT